MKNKKDQNEKELPEFDISIELGIPKIWQIRGIRRKSRMQVAVNKSNELRIPKIKHVELSKA